MCKFTNRLFVFALLFIFQTVFIYNDASPVHFKAKQNKRNDDLEDFLDLLKSENDYDLHYDQRQKGEENLRIKLDGFFISQHSSQLPDVNFISDGLFEIFDSHFLQRSTTPDPDDFFNFEQQDNEDKTTVQPAAIEPLIVEIPAPKKGPEARTSSNSSPITGKHQRGSKTKNRLVQLFNLFKQTRKQ